MATMYRLRDSSECSELNRTSGLYLKPAACIYISVQLPQLKSPDMTVSSFTVREKITNIVDPDIFVWLKVNKSSLEFIRFEAELVSRRIIRETLSQLESCTIRLPGFPDELRIRAAEAKPPGPGRHEWDSFFRDNKAMDENRPGERPDTVHLLDLPCQWFINRGFGSLDWYVVKKVFEQFGDVRFVDVPSLDPWRHQMRLSATGLRAGNNRPDSDIFDAFIQYKEYVGFVNAMTALRGKRLAMKDHEDRWWVAPFQLDFDRTCHLSERNISKRRLERDRLKQETQFGGMNKINHNRVNLEEIKRAKMRREKKEKEREEKRSRRRAKKAKEEARERKILLRKEKKKQEKEITLKEHQEREAQLKYRIETEERKLMSAQRKLETVRLLDMLFGRVKIEHERIEAQRREDEAEENTTLRATQPVQEPKEILKLRKKELKIRDQLVTAYKVYEEKRLEEHRGKLLQAIEDKKQVSIELARDAASDLTTSDSDSDDSDSDTSSDLSRSGSSSDYSGSSRSPSVSGSSGSRRRRRSRRHLRRRRSHSYSSDSGSSSSRSRYSRSGSSSRSRSSSRTRTRSKSRSRHGRSRRASKRGRMRMDNSPSRDYLSGGGSGSDFKPDVPPDPRLASVRGRVVRGSFPMRGRGFAPMLYDADGNEWRGPRGGRGRFIRRPWRGRGMIPQKRFAQQDDRFHYKRWRSGGGSSGGEGGSGAEEGEIRVRDDASSSGEERGAGKKTTVVRRVWSRDAGWVDTKRIERDSGAGDGPPPPPGRGGRPFGGRGFRPGFRPFRGGRGFGPGRGRGWMNRDGPGRGRGAGNDRNSHSPVYEPYYQAYERYYMKLAEREDRKANKSKRRNKSGSSSSGSSSESSGKDRKKAKRAKKRKRRRRRSSSSDSG